MFDEVTFVPVMVADKNNVTCEIRLNLFLGLTMPVPRSKRKLITTHTNYQNVWHSAFLESRYTVNKRCLTFQVPSPKIGNSRPLLNLTLGTGDILEILNLWMFNSTALHQNCRLNWNKIRGERIRLIPRFQKTHSQR